MHYQLGYAAFWCIALWIAPTAASLRQFYFTLHQDQRSPDGYARNTYLVNDQHPGPLIDVNEGDDVEVFVQNNLPVGATVHWHGLLQKGTPEMDGVPGVTQDIITPGKNYTYRFSTANQYGFYWYHSHFRTYYNDAIRGPFLIRPSPERRRPFASLANSTDDQQALLDAEKQAINVMLNDWTHELSDVIYNRYIMTGVLPFCVDTILANGQGMVQCLPEEFLERGGMGDVNPLSAPSRSQSTLRGMSSMDALDSHGCVRPTKFKPGYNASSLAMHRCENTTSPVLIIPADTSKRWLALNLVNAGAVSSLRVSLDRHSMVVYSADGLYVQPQKVQVLHMEIGQRYSVMIELDQPQSDYKLRFATYPSGDMRQVMEGHAVVSYESNAGPLNSTIDHSQGWMYVNGSARPGASLVQPAKLAPFDSADLPPRRRNAGKSISFVVNETSLTTWELAPAPYKEAKIPIIQGNRSDGWGAPSTFNLPANTIVDIIVNIANSSMDMMGHPLHLHGHKFWVLGSGEGHFPYASAADAPYGMLNFDNPPFRDSSGLPQKGWTVLRYVTDNPGAWIFHCHLQWHLVVGMAAVLVEGGDELSQLVGSHNQSALPAPSTAGSSQSSLVSLWLLCCSLCAAFAF